MPRSRLLIWSCLALISAMSSWPALADDPCPEPTQLHLAGSVQITNVGTMSLESCSTKENFIVCRLYLTWGGGGTREIPYGADFTATKFVDNFYIDHTQVRGYFVNGRGDHAGAVTLSNGETVCVKQEFGGAQADITNGKWVFINGRQSIKIQVDHPKSDLGPTSSAN